MAVKPAAPNPVESCQLGKFGSGGVALKLTFTTGAANGKQDPHRIAEFGMSRQVALGLALALTKILDDSAPATADLTEK